MNAALRRFARLLARIASPLLLALVALNAFADAGELRSKYTQLQGELRNNAYHRPIYIDSAEDGEAIKGDVYAVLDYPYETLKGALERPGDWCAIMLLPFNTKDCHPAKTGEGTKLAMRIGRKADQPSEQAYRLDLTLNPVTAGADYFESRLTSAQGPFGTRDYRITLAAIPLDGKRTFMHLSYAYAFGGMGRFAMQAYLSTAGASKVGFTMVGRDANGQPTYIGGMRGAIERNVMRYYLAIEAHLASLSVPSGQQVDKRIQTWFDSSERYARQLHEMDRSQYIAMKRDEYGRQAMVE